MLLAVLGAARVLGASPTGSVCVAALPGAATQGPYRSLGGGDGEAVELAPLQDGEISVQIAGRRAVPVQVKRATLIDSLQLGHKYTVQILGKLGAIASFPLRFERFPKPELCLTYRWGYDTWTLAVRKGCGCR